MPSRKNDLGELVFAKQYDAREEFPAYVVEHPRKKENAANGLTLVHWLTTNVRELVPSENVRSLEDNPAGGRRGRRGRAPVAPPAPAPPAPAKAKVTKKKTPTAKHAPPKAAKDKKGGKAKAGGKKKKAPVAARKPTAQFSDLESDVEKSSSEEEFDGTFAKSKSTKSKTTVEAKKGKRKASDGKENNRKKPAAARRDEESFTDVSSHLITAKSKSGKKEKKSKPKTKTTEVIELVDSEDEKLLDSKPSGEKAPGKAAGAKGSKKAQKKGKTTKKNGEDGAKASRGKTASSPAANSSAEDSSRHSPRVPTVGPWNCGACTFYNVNEGHTGPQAKCEMCEAPRPINKTPNSPRSSEELPDKKAKKAKSKSDKTSKTKASSKPAGSKSAVTPKPAVKNTKIGARKLKANTPRAQILRQAVLAAQANAAAQQPLLPAIKSKTESPKAKASSLEGGSAVSPSAKVASQLPKQNLAKITSAVESSPTKKPQPLAPKALSTSAKPQSFPPKTPLQPQAPSSATTEPKSPPTQKPQPQAQKAASASSTTTNDKALQPQSTQAVATAKAQSSATNKPPQLQVPSSAMKEPKSTPTKESQPKAPKTYFATEEPNPPPTQKPQPPEASSAMTNGKALQQSSAITKPSSAAPKPSSQGLAERKEKSPLQTKDTVATTPKSPSDKQSAVKALQSTALASQSQNASSAEPKHPSQSLSTEAKEKSQDPKDFSATTNGKALPLSTAHNSSSAEPKHRSQGLAEAKRNDTVAMTPKFPSTEPSAAKALQSTAQASQSIQPPLSDIIPGEQMTSSGRFKQAVSMRATPLIRAKPSESTAQKVSSPQSKQLKPPLTETAASATKNTLPKAPVRKDGDNAQPQEAAVPTKSKRPQASLQETNTLLQTPMVQGSKAVHPPAPTAATKTPVQAPPLLQPSGRSGGNGFPAASKPSASMNASTSTVRSTNQTVVKSATNGAKAIVESSAQEAVAKRPIQGSGGSGTESSTKKVQSQGTTASVAPSKPKAASSSQQAALSLLSKKAAQSPKASMEFLVSSKPKTAQEATSKASQLQAPKTVGPPVSKLAVSQPQAPKTAVPSVSKQAVQSPGNSAKLVVPRSKEIVQQPLSNTTLTASEAGDMTKNMKSQSKTAAAPMLEGSKVPTTATTKAPVQAPPAKSQPLVSITQSKTAAAPKLQGSRSPPTTAATKAPVQAPPAKSQPLGSKPQSKTAAASMLQGSKALHPPVPTTAATKAPVQIPPTKAQPLVSKMQSQLLSKTQTGAAVQPQAPRPVTAKPVQAPPAESQPSISKMDSQLSSNAQTGALAAVHPQARPTPPAGSQASVSKMQSQLSSNTQTGALAAVKPQARPMATKPVQAPPVAPVDSQPSVSKMQSQLSSNTQTGVLAALQPRAPRPVATKPVQAPPAESEPSVSKMQSQRSSNAQTGAEAPRAARPVAAKPAQKSVRALPGATSPATRPQENAAKPSKGKQTAKAPSQAPRASASTDLKKASSNLGTAAKSSVNGNLGPQKTVVYLTISGSEDSDDAGSPSPAKKGNVVPTLANEGKVGLNESQGKETEVTVKAQGKGTQSSSFQKKSTIERPNEQVTRTVPEKEPMIPADQSKIVAAPREAPSQAVCDTNPNQAHNQRPAQSKVNAASSLVARQAQPPQPGKKEKVEGRGQTKSSKSDSSSKGLDIAKTLPTTNEVPEQQPERNTSGANAQKLVVELSSDDSSLGEEATEATPPVAGNAKTKTTAELSKATQARTTSAGPPKKRPRFYASSCDKIGGSSPPLPAKKASEGTTSSAALERPQSEAYVEKTPPLPVPAAASKPLARSDPMNEAEKTPPLSVPVSAAASKPLASSDPVNEKKSQPQTSNIRDTSASKLSAESGTNGMGNNIGKNRAHQDGADNHAAESSTAITGKTSLNQNQVEGVNQRPKKRQKTYLENEMNAAANSGGPPAALPGKKATQDPPSASAFSTSDETEQAVGSTFGREIAVKPSEPRNGMTANGIANQYNGLSVEGGNEETRELARQALDGFNEEKRRRGKRKRLGLEETKSEEQQDKVLKYAKQFFDESDKYSTTALQIIVKIEEKLGVAFELDRKQDILNFITKRSQEWSRNLPR